MASQNKKSGVTILFWDLLPGVHDFGKYLLKHNLPSIVSMLDIEVVNYNDAVHPTASELADSLRMCAKELRENQ